MTAGANAKKRNASANKEKRKRNRRASEEEYVCDCSLDWAFALPRSAVRPKRRRSGGRARRASCRCDQTRRGWHDGCAPVLLDVRSHCTATWSGSFLRAAAWWRIAGREARPDGSPSRCKAWGDFSPLSSTCQQIKAATTFHVA